MASDFGFSSSGVATGIGGVNKQPALSAWSFTDNGVGSSWMSQPGAFGLASSASSKPLSTVLGTGTGANAFGTPGVTRGATSAPAIREENRVANQTITSTYPSSTVGGYQPPSLTPQRIENVTIPGVGAIGVTEAAAARIGALQQAIAARAEAARIGKMDTIEAAKLNREDELKIRVEQVALNEELKKVVAGTAGPSVAELQYAQASDSAARQQLGYAAARGGGGNYGLAMREAAQNQALIQAQHAQGAAVLRAQEVAMARGQMAELQTAIRAADIQVATTEANYRQQANMFNAEQVNMARIRQAELDTQVNMLNAQLENQVNMFNAGEYNAGQIRQAELDTQTNISNAGFANQIAIQNAQNQLRQQIAQAEMNANIGIHNAQLAQQIEITKAQIADMQHRQQQEISAANSRFAQELAQRQKEAAALDAYRQQELATRGGGSNVLGTVPNNGPYNPNVPGSGAPQDVTGAGTTSLVGDMARGGVAGAALGPAGVVGGIVIEGGRNLLAYNDRLNADVRARNQQWSAQNEEWLKKHQKLIAEGKDPSKYPISEGGTADAVQFGSAEEAAGPPPTENNPLKAFWGWINPFD